MNEQAVPSVTVILAIRNEAAFIERCLGAILAQDYPADKTEILIADGMSEDNTLSLIQALPGAERVRVIPNPERIQSAGLNRLITQAASHYIIRVDGHTIIAPDYVRQCVQTLQETGADNVGGGMHPVGTSPVGDAIAVAGRSRFAVPTAFHVSSTPQYTDTVYMGAWPRRVFDDIGLYSTDLPVNEDYELNYRIRANGGKIYFNPAIQSIYYSRQTWSALARQYYRYGRAKVQMLKKYPQSLRPRQTVAPLFVAGLVSGLPLSFIAQPLRWLYLGVIGLYLLLGLSAAIQATRTSDSRAAIWRVLLVFIVMHITWGAGFWREVIKPDRL